MYYNEKNKILISKSFKTAGSSLYELLNEYVGKSHGMLANNHYHPKQWRRMMGVNKNNSITVVGIRNPWDYVSSAYHWALLNGECPPSYSFNDFIFKPSEFNWQKQKLWWDVNEIDDIIIFEDLENEINRIAISYDIPEIVGKKLGWEKKTKNSDIDYKDMYKAMDEIFKIKDVFEDQLKFFRDKFGIEYRYGNNRFNQHTII